MQHCDCLLTDVSDSDYVDQMHERERWQLILNRLRERGIVRVNDLAAITGASLATLRRDLARLEDSGQLRRVHGGAETAEVSQGDLTAASFGASQTTNAENKLAVARKAASLCADGDSIIHFRNANVVHMGDTYFSGLYPFIDTGTNGSVKGVIAAVDRVLGMLDDTTKIIPGHGPLSGKRDLREYRDMLAMVAARVERMVKAKKTLRQVIAAKPSKDFDAVWGNGFLKPDQFVEIVYTSLAKGK